MIRFEDLILPRSPNTYLVAPDGLCQNATPHQRAPRFAAPAPVVKAAFDQVLAREPRISHSASDEGLGQYEWIQRSALMRFPDTITARFIALDAGASTLAIYSRSKFGRSDFGVNRARVSDWLAKLAAALR